MADAHALVSFMQSGAIAQGDLVLAPAALLPVEWRSSRGIEGRVRLVGGRGPPQQAVLFSWMMIGGLNSLARYRKHIVLP